MGSALIKITIILEAYKNLNRFNLNYEEILGHFLEENF